MQVKKSSGRIFGAVMTAAEKKAMNMEIQRQLAEYDRKHVLEIDAMILWVLHQRFGWGEARLRRFYDGFAGEISALLDRYQMEEEDKVWLCTQKLRDYGIDIEQWDRERKDRQTM